MSINDDLLATGRAEAERMRAATVDMPEDARVGISGGQFNYLAGLIDMLASELEKRLDERLDDARYWVPLAHFQMVKAEADRWKAECERLSQGQTLEELFPF